MDAFQIVRNVPALDLSIDTANPPILVSSIQELDDVLLGECWESSRFEILGGICRHHIAGSCS